MGARTFPKVNRFRVGELPENVFLFNGAPDFGGVFCETQSPTGLESDATLSSTAMKEGTKSMRDGNFTSFDR